MSTITTHVLDTARGCPAGGVPVRLERQIAKDVNVITMARTGSDGRASDLGPDPLVPGTYRLVFDTGAYFAATGQVGFFPDVSITFVVEDPSADHHVPLLLGPFGYTTYRGS